MKKVLSVLFVIIAVLTFSFCVFAEPDDEPIIPPSSEDSSDSSTTEDVTPPESSQEPQPDTSQESSSVQEPSESEESSTEESVSQDTSSSESPPSVPVINNNSPQPQSSAQTSSQEEESSQESQTATVKTKIYASDELIIISGSEYAFSENTVLKVNNITDGSEYLNASLALANKAVRFTLYSFTNESSEQPRENLSVNFSIPALYDMDKVAIYQIGENATATKLSHKLNKKTVKVTAEIHSLGNFAIVELFEPVNEQENTLNKSANKEIFVIICAAALLILTAITTTVLTIINKRK